MTAPAATPLVPATARPWLLSAQAGEVAVETRAALAARLREELEGRADLALLETCHRVELYGYGLPPSDPGWPPSARSFEGREAVRHLFRVAAGLESAVVGEDEILGQVRDAKRRLRDRVAPQAELDRMFDSAIVAGRSARAGRATISEGLAGRAADWLAARVPLAGARVLVVGAGHMGRALGLTLHRRGAHVDVASRRPARAGRLTSRFGGQALDLESAAARAAGYAAVAIALAGPWLPVAPITAPVVDLSTPPALDSHARAELGAAHLGIDELFTEGAVDHAKPAESAYINHAEAVVEASTEAFCGWMADRRERRRVAS